jgi:4-diphosphocytidyl-2-C-methyl-D-erythritol kinase
VVAKSTTKSRRAVRGPATHRVRDEAAVRTEQSDTLDVVTRAKVNLSLEVIKRRVDGFHEIETIFQSIDIADRMRIEFTHDGIIDIACATPGIPTDETNLCHRALVAMRAVAGRSLGARIVLEKGIPVGAGLGGGSSNAAGVMLAVDKALGLKLPPATLGKIAASLGSDVPFMLHGGTMVGRGRGELLTPLSPLKAGFFVIIKPEVSIPTAWVYSNLNFRLTRHRPRLNLRAVSAVLARFPKASLPFRNALEAVVFPAYPSVAKLWEELISERPCFASMTGSGSAVFAIFDREARAREVAERFSVRGLFASVAKPAKQAVDIR